MLTSNVKSPFHKMTMAKFETTLRKHLPYVEQTSFSVAKFATFVSRVDSGAISQMNDFIKEFNGGSDVCAVSFWILL